MPTLGLLRCHVKWQGGDQAMPERHTQYYDGGVHTYLGVPSHPTPFYVHVETTGFVATGLQAFVYMDGEYMCNRGKRNIPCPSSYLNPASSLVDLKLRQKEVPMSDGAHYGMPWQFAKVHAAPEGTPVSEFVPFGGQHVGVIEVVVLRHALESSGLPRGLLTAKQTAEWQAQAKQVPYDGPPRFGVDGAADDVKEAPGKSWFGDWAWGGDKKENAGPGGGWEGDTPNRSNNGPAGRNRPTPWTTSKIPSAPRSVPPLSQNDIPGPITINLTAAAGSAVNIGGAFQTAPPSRKVSKGTSSPTSVSGWGGRKAGLSNGSEPSPRTKKLAMPGAWDNLDEANENADPNDDWDNGGGGLNNSNDNDDSFKFEHSFDENALFESGGDNNDTFAANEPQNDYDRYSIAANDNNNAFDDPTWNDCGDADAAFQNDEAWVTGSQNGSSNIDAKTNQDWANGSSNGGNRAWSSNESKPPAQAASNFGGNNKLSDSGRRGSAATRARTSSFHNHQPRQQPAGDGPNDDVFYVKVQPQQTYIPLSQAQPGLFSINPGEPPKPYWTAWKHAKDRDEEFTRPVFNPHAGEQPVYSLPVDVLNKNLTTHQIQLGKPSVYKKVKFSPKYIDTMDKPFAVFTFNYRDEVALSNMFGEDFRESQADEANRLKALSTDEVLKIMYSRLNMHDKSIPSPEPSRNTRVIPRDSPVQPSNKAQPASAHTMGGALPASARSRQLSASKPAFNGAALAEALDHVVRSRHGDDQEGRSRRATQSNTNLPSSRRRSVGPHQYDDAGFGGGPGWTNNDENRRPPSSKRVSIAPSHRRSNAGNVSFGGNGGQSKPPSNADDAFGSPIHRQSNAGNNGWGGATPKAQSNNGGFSSPIRGRSNAGNNGWGVGTPKARSNDGGFGHPGSGSAGPGAGPGMHSGVDW